VNVPKVKITDKEALESIDPVDAARWLEHHGWEAGPCGWGEINEHFMSSKINKYIKFSRVVSGQTHIVELPIFSDVRDYALRMAEVLEVIAYVEQRSQLEIFYEINKIQ
jgi:hypothetical protein